MSFAVVELPLKKVILFVYVLREDILINLNITCLLFFKLKISLKHWFSVYGSDFTQLIFPPHPSRVFRQGGFLQRSRWLLQRVQLLLWQGT